MKRFAASCTPLAGLMLQIALGAGCTPEKIAPIADTAAPSVKISFPRNGQKIMSPTPTIEVAYSDDITGTAVLSFTAHINERVYSAEFDHHSLGASGKISHLRRLPLGRNRLVVRIADRNGNVGQDEINFINASGGYLSVHGADATKRYVELILDGSGSMKERLVGSTRMEVAKHAVGELLAALPDKTNLGLRVFHGIDNIKQLVPVGPLNKAEFAREVNAVQPDGGTPLVASLKQSFEALREFNDGERIVVLVTDGGESYGARVSDAVTDAKDAATKVFVIGFGITSEGIMKQLRQIALDTGGGFFDVQRPDDLKNALIESVLRISYKTYDSQGNQAAGGFVGGRPAELPIGTYEVRLDSVPAVTVKGVKVGSLTKTEVRLKRTDTGLTSEVRGPK